MAQVEKPRYNFSLEQELIASNKDMSLGGTKQFKNYLNTETTKNKNVYTQKTKASGVNYVWKNLEDVAPNTPHCWLLEKKLKTYVSQPQ